jgi:hypothetical protein
MNKLDQTINDIANESIPEDRMEQAAARVRQKLFPHNRATQERLRSCSDYQSLIPSYLNRTLSAGRSLLLQDHTRECPACRHALDQARSGNVRTLVRPVTPPSNTIPKWWAIAAMAALTLGIGALLVNRMLPTGSGRMTVASVRGILYSVSDTAVTPIFSGKEITEGQRVRTAKDSTAVVRLADGSMVELNERAEISVARAGRGTAIRLGRGNIIVQAAKQRNGTLDVVTADCTISVKGTIFAVDRGTKGSRVSVVEGSVQVAQGSEKQMLKPGQQVSTDASVETTSVGDAVAWSRDSTRYMALLGEFSVIKKGLEAMPSPALRHDSKLLPLAPADAVLYAAIPNVGPALAEADRLFKGRLQESPVLREWWEQQKGGPKLDAMLQKLRTFSDYLGDEIVFSISGDWDGNYSQPMLLAEVKKPGLDAFLINEFRQLALEGGKDLPEIVSINKPADGSQQLHGRRNRARYKNSDQPASMLIGVNQNLLAVAWNQKQMDELGDRIAAASPSAPQGGLLGNVREAYDRGAAWLLCVNMEQIANHVVGRHRGNDGSKLPAGLDAMRYLIVERKDMGGKTENQATLTFQGGRSGIAGWIAAPAPMGSLDFVSPNATFVLSMVLRSPESMLRDLFAALADKDPQFQATLDWFSNESGIRISPALGEPLGGEVTFAVDGPLLPLPSWKLAIEVYSPDGLQSTIEQFVAVINKDMKCADCKVTLAKDQSNGRTYYTLSSNKVSYQVDYTYVDGYLLAAPSRTLLNTAIQNRATGFTLAQSEAFRSQLPVGGNLNFSGVLYHNLGSALKPLADQLQNFGGATEGQRKSIAALAANTTPGLVYVYGQQDRITIASSSGFFGLDLNSFALPTIIGSAMQTHAPNRDRHGARTQ